MEKIFQYNNVNGLVELNTPEILLVNEFAKLMDDARNICPEDKTGKKKLRAFREFTYIWLAIDWKSVYADYPAQERHKAALADAKITEKEWEDPDFRAACRKYKAIQESNKYFVMLNSARAQLDKLTLYFQNVDPEERGDDGKPIFKVKDIQTELQNLVKVMESLTTLEAMVKKEIADTSSIRAGAVNGYTPHER